MSRAGRVLLVANNFPPVRGGSAAVYANLAQCAPDRIIVVAPRVSYADGLPIIGWRENDRHKPYRVLRLPLLRTRMAEAPLRGLGKLLFLFGDAAIRVRLACLLLWLVATQNVRTICVGELSASGWITRLFRALPIVQTVTYVHGEEITTEDLYDFGHRRARRALLASTRIVVVSRFTQSAVTDLLGAKADGRVALIENGVDGQRFRPLPKSQGLLDLYGLGGRFVFVSVCRLVEKKGVDNAIKAFAKLVAQYPDCRYLIVGGGPYDQTLRSLATELDVSEQVVFAGQVPDDELADHYRLGDVFAMPNRGLANGDTEGFGLVFLEANSCGLPVIAGCDGGSTDAVQHGLNGLVVDGSKVEDIAAAMLRLREDAGLRETLCRQGLAVAAGAGWSEKAQAFLELCDAAGGQRQARSS